MLKRKRALAPGAVAGLICSLPAAALDYDYALYSSAEYSDNIRQSAALEDAPSGGILRGGVEFGLATDTSATFAADVNGDLSRVYYSDGDLDTENRNTLDAALVFQPASSNFQLSILEALEQVEEDRRTVRTVNNLRDVNVFSVVPSYYIDLTSISRIRAAYSYSRIDEELDLASRDVETVTLGYEYKLSNLSDLSINVSQSDIDFIDRGNEYEQESAFFRWVYTGGLTDWSLDLGQQRIVEVDDTDLALINFSLARRVNNFSNLGLFYNQGYSDVVNTRVGGRLTNLVPNSDAVFADELAREKQAGVFYSFSRGTLDGSLRFSGRSLESEEAVSVGTLIDEDRYTFTLGLDYRFRNEQYNLSQFGIGLSYRYMDETFNLENEENQVNEAAVRVDYFATRTTSFFVELRSRNTAGTSPVSETDENAAMIGIRFSPRGGN